MTPCRTAALALAAALALGPALAQTAPKKPPAKKPAPTAAKKTTPPPASLPPPGDEQRAAADLAHFGDYACEFNQTVNVSRAPRDPGYVDVRFGKLVYTMKPVLSTTGALRLEDVKGQALMLQIAFKSMLMDVKQGRRLVDECVHEKQLAARKAAEGQPAQAGIGIDPAKAAAEAQAAAAVAALAASAAAEAASAAESAASAAAQAASAASAPASSAR